jgi:very-short-patch-repair endonuclease
LEKGGETTHPSLEKEGREVAEAKRNAYAGNAASTSPATPPFSKGGRGGIPGQHDSLTINDFDPRLKRYARDLRTHQTDAEQHLWQRLRRDQLGVRFLRQRPLGQYIVDFYSPKARLVVELDGSQHYDDPAQREKDVRRDAWLASQGLRVLRFDDRQALTETEAALEVILAAVREATAAEIPPSPPFSKGGASISPTSVNEGSLPLEKGGDKPEPPFEKGGLGGFSGASSPRKPAQ